MKEIMHRLNQLLRGFPRIALYLLYTAITFLTINAYIHYAGEGYVYLLFTVISNVLLYLGFRKKALFFDTFIGIFFWLGFWLKVTVRVGFSSGVFHEPTGSFDGSGAAFDRGLLVASSGLFALVVATLIRERFFCYPDKDNQEIFQKGLFNIYQKNRGLVLISFIFMFLFISLSNLYFGIYQRGQVPGTILPYGLGGIYKWLLLFGLASFAAIILRFEYLLGKKNPYWVAVLSLGESFFSNVSLLSRGMVLNSTALFYGLFKSLKFNSVSLSLRFLVIISLIFSVFFVSSVLLVNYLRSHDTVLSRSVDKSKPSDASTRAEIEVRADVDVRLVKGMTTPLFIDRWVGIEGVLAVSSSQKVGPDLWQKAWKEIYSDYGTSFYDLNLIKSPYLGMDVAKNHYISLPGIIAFCFYLGSFWFLFGAMFLIGLIGASIDVFVYKFGGKNLILCSLLAQVVAFRFASFGYVPSQTYLLFGTLFLNVIIIYGADKLLKSRSRNGITS